MNTRTKQETAIFTHPFTMDGVDGVQPAGSYIVQIEEEVIESLSRLAYRRVETSMLVPLRPGSSSSVQSILIKPRDLEDALARDRATLPLERRALP